MERNYKKLYASSLAFFASMIVILIMLVMVHFLVPDKLDIEYILANFAVPISDFVAEKSEKIQYMLSVLLFPPLFFGFYLFFKKNIEKFSEKFFKLLLSFEVILGVILFIVSTMFSKEINIAFPLSFPNIFIPIIGSTIFAIGFILYNKSEKYKKILTMASFLMSVFFIYQTFNFYNTQSLAYTNFTLWHFEAYFYPVYKLLSGMTPGIDFRNLYGFYPYIYSLFFNLENISIPKFAMTNCILMTLTVTFFIFAVYKNIKNKIIAFVTTSSCVLFCLLQSFYIFTLYYYQYMPHRIFFPMLIVLLITIYLNLKNEKLKNILEYSGYIISSLAIFWNLESGIAALSGWGSMFFYLSLNKENKIKNIILVFLKVILSIIFAFLGIFIVTYLHSSQIINPLGLFFGQFVFFEKGFYMLKMNFIKQPFLLVLIPYFIGLGNSIKNAVENNVSKNDIFKFSLSVIGFATFIYFQGRSHIHCLAAVSWPAFIMVGILMEEYYLKYLHYKNQSSNLSCYISKINLAKFSMLFVLFSVFTVQSIFFINNIAVQLEQYKRKQMKETYQDKNLKLLDKNEKYDILTYDSSYYYIWLRQPDNIPVSHFLDCFFKKDIEDVHNYLIKSDKKLVVDGLAIISTGLGFIEKYYTLEKTNGAIYIYKHK